MLRSPCSVLQVSAPSPTLFAPCPLQAVAGEQPVDLYRKRGVGERRTPRHVAPLIRRLGADVGAMPQGREAPEVACSVQR